MTTNEGMKELIALINKLQDAASVAGLSLGRLDLPQIAVVGGQSAGKSSVLENFVGRDFLPRGSGIVTRRPLVLQLHNCEEEYAEFLHLPGKRFNNFLEVRREIEAETDRETGMNKGISNRPINLRVYSPHVLELTLVDLPGITKVPVGDQPHDIEMQIRNMILEYIVQENTLILAVSPANQDLANSDALKLALSVDPDGIRTIGVITKLDLMDRGTDAKDILENKVFALRRGYVGLVNRSQADIDGGKDIRVAQAAETEYFTRQEAYKHMSERMGTKYLQKVLNQQLCEHIRDRMPLLKANIKKQHQEVTKELEEMKAFTEGTDSWRQTMIIKLLQEFSEDFKCAVEGNSIKVEGTQLSAGARINSCIYEQVFKLLDQMVPPNEKEIKILIQNQHGFRSALFTSELTFDVIIRELLRRYADPVKRSVELVSTIINSTVLELSKKFVDYPRLKDVVQTLLTERLKSYEERAKKHLQIHLDAQAAFMNNKHPDFIRVTDPNQIPSDYKKKMRYLNGRMQRAESDDSLNSTPPQPEDESATAISGSPHLPHTPVSRSGVVSSAFSVFGNSGGGASTGSSTMMRSPSVANIAPSVKPSIVHKGWICILGSGIRKAKECWFILMTDSITWFREENEKEQLGFIFVEGLKLTSKGKHGKFVFSMQGRPISREMKTMTFTFRDEKTEEIWCQAFQKVGIELTYQKKTPEDSVLEALELAASRNSNAPMSDEQSKRRLYQTVASDPEIQEGNDMLVFMVNSYMTIIDKTVHDLVPKYIILLLVNQIVEYTTKVLLAEVMDGDTWKELLEVSAEEVTKRERLFSIYDSTKKAIEIMNAVNFSA